jgi:hypothetical protein
VRKRVTFDFAEFNEECELEGIAQFPVQTVSIDIDDDEHFRLSIKNFQDHLERWWSEQQRRK